MIDERIIQTYQHLGSVQDTAEFLGVSVVKVRRTLITVGLWHSRSSDAVCKLLDQGLSTEQIAEKLCITSKAVEANSPYKQGSYNCNNRSSDAQRCAHYRMRKQFAFGQQVGHANSGLNTKGEHVMHILANKPGKTIHLHLELNCSILNESEADILRKYGKVEKTISRDVLVPRSMTLHALHYVIQRAFGWQNSHLHHFELPEETFEMLTGGMFKRWGELCGIYFRMPSENTEDLYWDDDYDGTVSFKSWLRKKYCGPYRYEGCSELYLECQNELLNFYKQVPTIAIRVPFEEFCKNPDGPKIEKTISPKEATIDEVSRSVIFDGGLEALLERLTLSDILILDSSDERDRIDKSLIEAIPVSKGLRYFYDYGDGWEVNIALVEHKTEAPLYPEIGETEKPLCIAQDGLCVLDDVGGIAGYCQFLHDIRHQAAENREELRDWARMHGWTGRMQKPENLL